MLEQILLSARQCQLCTNSLPLGPNPVIQAAPSAKLLIIGQAPGLKVHESSIPWNDASGVRLRSWLQLDEEQFYNPEQVAIVPMGLCYPGKGNSGDLPPRKECAPQWHQKILEHLPNVKMTLLIGQYAQNYYLQDKPKSLTDTVKQWRQWAPTYIPLPHPSPRNNIWIKRNPWFESDVLPFVSTHIQNLFHR